MLISGSRKQALTNKMSVEERDALKSEIDEKERQVAELKEMGMDHLARNSDRNRQDLARKKMALERDQEMVATGRSKDVISKRIRELEEMVVKDRPTTEMMNRPLGTRESADAVKANLEFHRKHGKTIVEIQNLRKRLEPDDPGSNNMEYLRPDVYRKKFNV